jgi:hypothetical protein
LLAEPLQRMITALAAMVTELSSMATVDWSIKGPHFVNCNCDYGCPCQFNALPTYRTCVAINTYAWPGAVHEGDGSMQSIIDARADARQRAALTAILQGEGAEPGVTMLQIYRSMCRVVHPPLFAPIELAIDVPGRSARLNVADLIETTVEPIRNPVTGAEHRARIDLPLGKEYQLAEIASGTTTATGAVPLRFAHRHAHLVYNALTSQGPAAP